MNGIEGCRVSGWGLRVTGSFGTFGVRNAVCSLLDFLGSEVMAELMCHALIGDMLIERECSLHLAVISRLVRCEFQLLGREYTFSPLKN